MDIRLIAAAQTGNTEALLKLVEEDSLLLYKVSLLGEDTPLHISSMAGHLSFVQEILNLRKEFARELSQEGVSPLHIASANGYVNIVKQLLEIDSDLCLMKGRERRIPLHYAAIKGRTHVLHELLATSPDSVEEVTARGETALHLTVKNNQFEVLVILVNHLKDFNKDGMLNKQDEQGNTILHLGVSKKQYEVVDLLLGQNSVCKAAIEVNSMNRYGLTPLDTLLLFQSEAGDREIEEILRQAGGTRAEEINRNTATIISQNEPPAEGQVTSPLAQLVEYFRYDSSRETPGEVRNTLLVIASLIATATYTAVLQPPGGVWQQDSVSGNEKGNTTGSTNYTAGKSVMGDKDIIGYGLFLLFNSLGFFASLNMIYILTSGFPMQIELQIAVVALTVTYDSSLYAISQRGTLSTFFTIISIVIPVLIPITTLIVRNYLKRPRNTSTFSRV